MATHNAPLAHIAYQQPDGTTGVLDPHDELALHDVPGSVKSENPMQPWAAPAEGLAWRYLCTYRRRSCPGSSARPCVEPA